MEPNFSDKLANKKDPESTRDENNDRPAFFPEGNEPQSQIQGQATTRDPYAEENRKIQIIILSIIGICGFALCLVSTLFPIAGYFYNKYTLMATSSAYQATASSASQQWRVVTLETFNDNKAKWPTGTGEDKYDKESQTIKNGKYVWDAAAKKGFVGWIYPFPDLAMNDFYAAVECKVDGPSDAQYGLIFRRDANGNYYYFELENSGSFSLNLRYNDAWKTLIRSKRTLLIKKGEVNRLTVLGEGSHFIFFINDSYVADYTNDQLGHGAVYVAISLDAGEHAVYEFDNFELRTR